MKNTRFDAFHSHLLLKITFFFFSLVSAGMEYSGMKARPQLRSKSNEPSRLEQRESEALLN